MIKYDFDESGCRYRPAPAITDAFHVGPQPFLFPRFNESGLYGAHHNYYSVSRGTLKCCRAQYIWSQGLHVCFARKGPRDEGHFRFAGKGPRDEGS